MESKGVKKKMLEVTDVSITKHESGKLLGFVNIEFNGFMTWRDCKIFRSNNGGVQVSLPTKLRTTKVDKETYKPVLNEEGKDIWDPVIKLDYESEAAKAFMNQLNDAVSKKYQALTKGKATQQPQTPEDNGDGIPF